MPDFLKRENEPDLAYIRCDGGNNDLPTVVFLGGFRSDMEGTKATYLEAECKKRDQSYVRFDYRGHGQSGGMFEEGCIGEWTKDAQDIIETQTRGPVILIGSSMGGWVSLLLAQKIERIVGLIGLAAAPDFTLWMEERMNDEQRAQLASDGFFLVPNDYGEPYKVTQKILDDGRANALLEKGIHLDIPVRLIQGMKDADVEWQVAHRIKNAISGDDVEVILLENADHRLSKPDELEMIGQTLRRLIEK
jgi:pimeloyl-ACP methyl ester carboxylesterase